MLILLFSRLIALTLCFNRISKLEKQKSVPLQALVVQSHREIQRERREIEKHLIEEDRRREKEKRYHSVLQDVESLNSEIEVSTSCFTDTPLFGS